ncbi:hypothetical protein [Saccharopolyspora taberi]|uniref:DUF600 family protein n=1 Tax=Saccharopolyspora taberi TaxID=60895 RepID=A0ABN3VPA6_9PSEU
MTQPSDLGPEEQKDLLDSLASTVLSSAPEDWQVIAIEFMSVGRHVELGVGVHDSNGNAVTWEPPAEVDAIFWKLRVGMAREELGTWFSALFRLRPPDNYEILYNRDHEPPWSAPDESFAQELEMFPRSDENIPSWLSARL